MISKTTVMLGAATCLSVATGLFAPEVICEMQSRLDSGATDAFKATQITFEPTSHGSVLEALQLLGNSRNATAMYEMSGGAQLTTEEVMASIREATTQVEGPGFSELFGQGALEAFATPYLYVSQDRDARSGNTSAIIWECELMVGDSESTGYASVDDATGKVIAYAGVLYYPFETITETSLTPSRPSLEELRHVVESWGKYWGLGLSLDQMSEVERVEESVSSSIVMDEMLSAQGAYVDGMNEDASVELRTFEAEAFESEGMSSVSDGSTQDAKEAAAADEAEAVAASDDDRAFEKLVSKYVSEWDTERLSALYDAAAMEVTVPFEDDPSLKLRVQWRVNVSYGCLYVVWTMMPY